MEKLLEKILEEIKYLREEVKELRNDNEDLDNKVTRVETKVTNFLNVNDVSIVKDGSLNDKKKTIFLETNDDKEVTVSLLHDDVRLSTLKQFLSYRLGTYKLKFKNGDIWEITK